MYYDSTYTTIGVLLSSTPIPPPVPDYSALEPKWYHYGHMHSCRALEHIVMEYGLHWFYQSTYLPALMHLFLATVTVADHSTYGMIVHYPVHVSVVAMIQRGLKVDYH